MSDKSRAGCAPRQLGGGIDGAGWSGTGRRGREDFEDPGEGEAGGEVEAVEAAGAGGGRGHGGGEGSGG